MTETVARGAVRWTVADLESFPDDGVRREIIDGELFVSLRRIPPTSRSCCTCRRRSISGTASANWGACTSASASCSPTAMQ